MAPSTLAVAPVSLLRFGVAFPEAFWHPSYLSPGPSHCPELHGAQPLLLKLPLYFLAGISGSMSHHTPTSTGLFPPCVPIHPFSRYSWGASVAMKRAFSPSDDAVILIWSFRTYSLSTYYAPGTVGALKIQRCVKRTGVHSQGTCNVVRKAQE